METVELFFGFWRTATSFIHRSIQGLDSQEVTMNCVYELVDVCTLDKGVRKFVCTT